MNIVKRFVNIDIDKHRNLYWNYNGKPELENNITRAFINTIAFMKSDDRIRFIENIIKRKLCANPSFNYYLQIRSTDAELKSIIMEIPESNRLLIAFSPTGKSWGYSGIENADIDVIEQSIRHSLSVENFSEDEIEERIKEELKIIKEIQDNKGESIPDACIIIKESNEYLYCIAFENKLYDLNPFQLKNHLTKTLMITSSNNNIIYVSYKKIMDIFNNFNDIFADEFIKYMFLLGYYDIESLEGLQDLGKIDKKKYVLKRMNNVMKDVSIDRNIYHQRGWMDYIDTHNLVCCKVGFTVDDESNIVLYFYICTKQNIGRKYYGRINISSINIQESNTVKFIKSFHFGKQGGYGNVDGTYCTISSNCSLEEYIDFWKKIYYSLNVQIKKKEETCFIK